MDYDISATKEDNTQLRHQSSFRDPSGFIFVRDNIVYRQINSSYFENYYKLTNSGLHNLLADKGFLIPHKVVDQQSNYIVIEPREISFFTYPYEWCFSQLKDAAITTLEIQLLALDNGMSLKDATAFNVAFEKNSPIFIDTLSFEAYREGEPWAAYGQFCRHFLCPLLLWKYQLATNWNFGQDNLEGSDLELTSKLLPLRTYLNPTILTNVHLHSKAVRKYKKSQSTPPDKNAKAQGVSRKSLTNIIKSLLLAIRDLDLEVGKDSSQWSGYYSFSNYNREDFELKESTVVKWISDNEYGKIWDIGANDGHFSRLIESNSRTIYSSDYDSHAVESNYLKCKSDGSKYIVPFVANMVDPSPGIGFGNNERSSLLERFESIEIDCILALALVHHLCISNNSNFAMLASLWSKLAPNLIIEFVDPEDSWASHLLEEKRNNAGLFDWYNQKSFEEIFSEFYEIREIVKLGSGNRTLYHMSRTIS